MLEVVLEEQIVAHGAALASRRFNIDDEALGRWYDSVGRAACFLLERREHADLL